MGGRGSHSKSSKSAGAVIEKKQQEAELKPLNTASERRDRAAEITDHSAAHTEFVKENLDWGKSLTSDERYAVSHYQGSGYHNVNSYLRHTEKPEDEKLKIYESYGNDSSVKQEITRLTSALDKSSLHKPVVVYRGLGSKTYSEEQLKSMVGKTYFEGGFMSTTLKKDIGLSWGQGVAYKITMPKGAKAAYIDAKSANEHTSGFGEYELLVQRGARFKITGYHTEKWNNSYGISKERTVIDMRYIGQKPKDTLKFKG